MGLKLITAATDTIISLAEAKAHLRVSDTDNDTLIESLIEAVVSYVEGPRGYLARALADQTWDYYLDDFPRWFGVHYRHHHHGHHREIEIPLPPLIEVIGVFYRDTAGDEQELDATTYIVDTGSEPARINLASGKAWPSICPGLNAVRVRFRAGYLDTSSPPAFALPGAIKSALLMFLSTLYENRSETIIGSTAVRLPFASECLLEKYIASRGFA